MYYINSEVYCSAVEHFQHETGLRKEMEGALSLYHEAAETYPVNAE